MSVLHYRVNFSVPWHIKKIQVEDSNSPNKFNKMIRAIRNSKSVPGYSEVLWQVSQPNAVLAWNLGHAVLVCLNIHIPQSNSSQISCYWCFKDPDNQQWKANTSIKWALNHWISTGVIRLRLFEMGKAIIDEEIQVDGMQGGRLGVFCMSQQDGGLLHNRADAVHVILCRSDLVRHELWMSTPQLHVSSAR